MALQDAWKGTVGSHVGQHGLGGGPLLVIGIEAATLLLGTTPLELGTDWDFSLGFHLSGPFQSTEPERC